MQKHYIGIDGGGTKTSFVLINDNSETLAEALTGGSNWNNVGIEKSKDNLKEGIESLLSKANKNLNDCGICLGMSGVDRPEDVDTVKTNDSYIFTTNLINKVKNWMKEIVGDKPTFVYSDAVIALAAGTNGLLHGVVVISGTGMIAFGFNKNGEENRAGGWGPLLGDQGSGFDIGQEALRAAVKCSDGRGEKTELLNLILNHLKLEKPDELIPWAYEKQNFAWDKFADLSKLVFECYEKDPVALNILEKSADSLSECIFAVINNSKMQEEKFDLVLAGGNLTHENSKLASLLTERVNKKNKNINVVIPSSSPVLGAAKIAKNNVEKNIKQ